MVFWCFVVVVYWCCGVLVYLCCGVLVIWCICKRVNPTFHSGMYFDHPEIVPDGIQGDFRFNKGDEPASRLESNGRAQCLNHRSRFASKETEVRALIEGQLMAKRIHAERVGFKVDPNTRILVTGGASVNQAILQVIADVFNAAVYTQVRWSHQYTCNIPAIYLQPASNSAALGGAYRAVHLARGGTYGQVCYTVTECQHGPGIIQK